MNGDQVVEQFRALLKNAKFSKIRVDGTMVRVLCSCESVFFNMEFEIIGGFVLQNIVVTDHGNKRLIGNEDDLLDYLIFAFKENELIDIPIDSHSYLRCSGLVKVILLLDLKYAMANYLAKRAFDVIDTIRVEPVKDEQKRMRFKTVFITESGYKQTYSFTELNNRIVILSGFDVATDDMDDIFQHIVELNRLEGKFKSMIDNQNIYRSISNQLLSLFDKRVQDAYQQTDYFKMKNIFC